MSRRRLPMLLATLLAGACGAPEPPAFLEPVHRFAEESGAADDAPPATATLGRDTRPVLSGQPFAPGRAAGRFVLEAEGSEENGAWPRERRAAFESQALRVPERGRLALGLGVLAPARERGAVHFRVSLCDAAGCDELLSESLDPASPGGQQQAWRDHELPLDAHAGRTARFRFEVAHRQRDAASFTLPVWSDPVLYRGVDRAPAGLDLVLLSVDTLGARHLPTWGYARDTAPYVAELAARGTVLERCIAPATTTGPSHMTLFTSLAPTVHEVMGRLENTLPPGVRTLAERLRERGFATGAVTGDGPLAAARGFARGFGSYVENTGDALEEERGQVDVTFAGGRAWLGRNPRRRVFLFLHTFQVHGPYAPPQAYRTLYADVPAGTASVGDAAGAGSALSRKASLQALLYDQEIRYVDDELARFHAALDAQGFWEHALLVLIADHGEAFGEHGSMRHGPDPYEEVLHVPCLFVGPGIAPGRRVTTPIGLGELMPALLELTGAASGAALAERRLVPVLRGEAPADALEERPVFSGAYSSGRLSRSLYPSYTVRLGDRKLVRREEVGGRYRYEYYDLADDPGETRDLYREHHPGARELRDLLEDFHARSRAQRRALRAAATPTRTDADDALDAEREARLRALGYLE